MKYQLDFCDTIDKKIYRMEKWLRRIQHQAYLYSEEIKAVKMMHKMNSMDMEKKTIKIQQLDLFTG